MMDQHLVHVPPETRATVEAARRMIRALAPQAVEVPYQSRPPANPSTMWKLARYTLNGENVVGIGTYTKHSTLYFYRGRELDDGSGLLQGSGKDARFMTLRAPADAKRSDVTRLVKRAFQLQPASKARG